MEKTVNMNEIQNMILKHDFCIQSMLNGFPEFQYIDSWEKLGLTEAQTTPVNVRTHSPEKAILAIPTPANTGWPNAAHTGYLYALTGYQNRDIANPNLYFWIDMENGDVYTAAYCENSLPGVWRKISEASPAFTTVNFGTGDSGTFSYRMIDGRYVEAYINIDGEAFPSEQSITTIPSGMRPAGHVYTNLCKWANNDSSAIAQNTLRIASWGTVSLITNSLYVRGYVLYAIA